MSQVAHLPAFLQADECKVVGLFDMRPDLLSAVGLRFGVDHLHHSLDSLIEQGGIDALVVSLPRRSLGPAVLKGLQACLPVLSEKPMAMTIDGARCLAEAARLSKQPYVIGFMKRHDPGVALFREQLVNWRREKIAGEIEHVLVWDFCGGYGCRVPEHVMPTARAPNRFTEWPSLPDGLDERFRSDYDRTINVMLHDINLIRYLLNDSLAPVSFRLSPMKTQTAVLAASSYDVTIVMGRSNTGIWNQAIDVIFEQGSLRLLLPSPLDRTSTACTEMTLDGHTQNIEAPKGAPWAFFQQADNFVRQVLNKDIVTAADGHDCLADLEIADELWRGMNCQTSTV